MEKGRLSTAFQKEGQASSAIDAQAYRVLLEKLLAQGKGYGKTKPVAAYFLRDLHVVQEDGGIEIGNDVKIQSLYLVLDLTQWPNRYARSLAMQDIWTSYAKRMVGEREVNSPDFKGPGIWTSKPGNFEFDYKRRKGKDDDGLDYDIFDPNPEAYRICLPVDQDIIIPTQWGEYSIKAGGALAVREADVQELAEALQSVRNGKTKIEDALYQTDRKTGEKIARFDVYGIDPGFLEANYGPVQLKPLTQETMATFSGPVLKPPQLRILER